MSLVNRFVSTLNRKPMLMKRLDYRSLVTSITNS